MIFAAKIEVTRLRGPEYSEEDVFDALCGSLGRQNAAPNPFHFYIPSYDESTGKEVVTVYEILGVDDA